jgi:hypothetical protein
VFLTKRQQLWLFWLLWNFNMSYTYINSVTTKRLKAVMAAALTLVPWQQNNKSSTVLLPKETRQVHSPSLPVGFLL